MRDLIYRFFITKITKLIIRFQRHVFRPGLFYLIDQQAMQDSAQYALDNFSEAMQFDTRQELWSYCLNRIPQLQTGG